MTTPIPLNVVRALDDNIVQEITALSESIEETARQLVQQYQRRAALQALEDIRGHFREPEVLS